MGKGDKKSKKGKIWRGSYGNSRNRNAIKERMARAASGKPAASATESQKAEKPRKKATKKKESAE